jgi:putative zinc finger/helix-turn-helix YgiT family protein
MKTNRKKETAELPPPMDECVACGAEGSYVRVLTRTRKDFRGETFTVKHHHWKCSECSVAVLGDAEMDEAMRATVAAYQQAHGLLTAFEIREARSRMRWSQQQLADRTRLSIATIKRLELGGVVQTDTNDDCLRAALGSALNGAFVFMHTEQFGVVSEHLTESWEEGWNHEVEVRHQEVALDANFGNLCLV